MLSFETRELEQARRRRAQLGWLANCAGHFSFSYSMRHRGAWQGRAPSLRPSLHTPASPRPMRNYPGKGLQCKHCSAGRDAGAVRADNPRCLAAATSVPPVGMRAEKHTPHHLPDACSHSQGAVTSSSCAKTTPGRFSTSCLAWRAYARCAASHLRAGAGPPTSAQEREAQPGRAWPGLHNPIHPHLPGTLTSPCPGPGPAPPYPLAAAAVGAACAMAAAS